MTDTRTQTRTVTESRTAPGPDLRPGLTLRPITPEEFPAFARAGELPFHSDARDEDIEIFRICFPFERSLAVFDGDSIVATSGAFDFELTVPGGILPTAGVTAVGVYPTHRRRGLLTAMMRRQLDDYHEQGLPLAALWASESVIYGRFGYGLASHCLAVRVPRGAAFRPGTAVAPGRLRFAEVEDAIPALVGVDDAVRRGRPGHYARPPQWWKRTTADPEHWRGGATSRKIVLHDGTGGVDGYLMYAVKSGWNDGVHTAQTIVSAIDATTPATYAALWRFALDMDLVDDVMARARALDEPLLHLLADPRRARPVLRDNLFLRLVDVGPALAGRTYSRDLDVVLDVEDAFCPWNARRYRLSGDDSGARCEPTADAADLRLSASDLSAVFLGGTTLETLSRAGRVGEERAGALRVASQAFRGDIEPWCPEVF